MNIKTKITKIHYSKNAQGCLFKALKFCSGFYAVASLLKNFLYDEGILKSQKVDAFVISVGNITTGGVGKTPVVSEIAKYFITKAEKVAIISRGYGGALSNKQINVISDGKNIYYNARLAGDEPLWLAQNTKGAIVITSKNRVAAAKFAVEKFGVKKIILDDGLQHRRLYRDLDIMLIDSEKRFGNAKLLPAGPLREGKEAFLRVNRLVVVSKNTDHAKAEKFAKTAEKKLKVKTSMCYTEPAYTYNINSEKLLKNNAEIVAMSAIGQPEQFYKFLSDFKISKKITFDDHHIYSLSDIEGLDKPIVTTEKDAVKLKDFGLNNIYALRLKTRINVEELLRG